MKPTSEIDAVREKAILSSLAGFPFLMVYSVVWISAALLSYVVPSGVAPWLYLLGGVPAAPIAIALERRVGYVRATGPDPLLPLTLQILFVQIVAFPAIMIVWDLAPNYVPVAFAAVVGAHFLPFQWVYRTRLYGVLGVAVAGGVSGRGAGGPEGDSLHGVLRGRDPARRRIPGAIACAGDVARIAADPCRGRLT